MLDQDTIRFLNFIKESGGIVIQINPKDKKLVILNNLSAKLDLKGKIYITKKEFVGSIFFYKVKENWYVDENKSLVIEFIPSKLVKEGLNWGRIWTEFKFWHKTKSNIDALLEKPKSFQKWYLILDNWIRKNYIKKESLYYSPIVIEWIKNGGKVRFNW